jgi:hypothetical protein
MFKKALYFIKYNNFAIIIFALVFLFGGSVFATETGQEIVIGKEVRIEGLDNTLLLSADLENVKMDFSIEKIETDDNNYYITYTFIDLTPVNNSWQYLLREKEMVVSKKINKDLGVYLGEELSEEYQSRIKELKKEQEQAKSQGETKRVEVTEYTGLIGKILDVSSRVFSNYNPVETKALPSPVNKLKLTEKPQTTSAELGNGDDLSQIYGDFLKKSDPDNDNIFYENDNCPEIFNPDQKDGNGNGIGDACEVVENIPVADNFNDNQNMIENISDSNVEIIDLNNQPPAIIDAETPADSSQTVIDNVPDSKDTIPEVDLIINQENEN